MSLSLVNWNVEWATPRSPRAPEILRRIRSRSPEVVCLTETHERLLCRDGYAICSQADAGYGIKEYRRKVLLWSKKPWKRVDDLDDRSLPPGRFVSGVTETSLGEIAVLGVCIPWFGSRTEKRRGEERKAPWEDHEEYLDGLTNLLKDVSARPLIVLGDFNQMIGPESSASCELREKLQGAFPAGVSIATAALTFKKRKSIDHIALSEELAAESVRAISNFHKGKDLSDHFGVAAELVCSAGGCSRSAST